MMKILNQIKETTAPSLFTKALLKYKQGNFEEARNLMIEAVKKMPDMKNDNFYKATFLLIKSESGENFETSDYKEALNSIKDSPYKETDDFRKVETVLKYKLNHQNRR